jgi:putative endopeptidase
LGQPGEGLVSVLQLDSIDSQLNPGDNFFRYANATWLDSTEIPADQAVWNEWNRLAELNAQRCRDILERCADSPKDDSEKQLGDLYASLSDSRLVETVGFAPLQAELQRIQGISDRSDLSRELAQLSSDWLHNSFASMHVPPLSIGSYWDYMDPVRYLPAILQGGLGVPDRDYLLGDNEQQQEIRNAYRQHLQKLFELASQSDAPARAEKVLQLEKTLAQSHRPRRELADLKARYNPWTREEFDSKAPGLDWEIFLQTAGMPDRQVYLVADPDAIGGAAAAVRDQPLQAWRDYLVVRALMRFAPAGPAALREEIFDFQERTLAGTPVQTQRWRQVVKLVDLAMGHAVGKLYLKQYFPTESQAAAEQMATGIQAAMARRLKKLDWMSEETRERALKKLEGVLLETGGEARTRDYSGLVISRSKPYANLLNAARFEYQRNIDKLDKPLDRTEWEMLPQTVNAQSNPILRKVMIPAGLMQGLFFNPQADPAVNYGAAGMVMGHEYSHQFDNLGSMFDETGAFNNWWTEVDYQKFSAATAAMAEQYSAYEPLPRVFINGQYTLAENIADLTGLTLAYDAWQHSTAGQVMTPIDGYSGEQRFFLSFAQVWREKVREEHLRQRLSTGTHTPGEWRVAQVRNLDAWYQAFDVTAENQAYLSPEQRVRIW